MALFSRQFEGLFDLTEIVQASVTIASTAAGASSTVSTGAIASSQAQPGDIVLVIPSFAPTLGTTITASVTAAGTFSVNTSVATGGSTYNPGGAQTLTFVVLRSTFKGAS